MMHCDDGTNDEGMKLRKQQFENLNNESGMRN